MDIQIELGAGRGRRDAIYRQIREAILDGRLRAGDALPPTRELAQRLVVSRNTVSAAYDRLVAEGFLEARVGSGTFVGAGARRDGAGPGERAAALTASAAWDDVPRPPRRFAERPEYDFRSGAPDVSLFPFETWRRLMTQQLRRSHHDLLTYGDPQGHAGLRAAIARHIGVSRDVRVAADDVLVTNGSQQAVDLAARVLLEPGDRVAVEEPGYPPPRQLFATLGARPVGVPVDEEGIVVDAIPDGCRLVYVTPSHQFPLGVPMSMARRLALIEWACRNDAAILEDDYDTEFRYTGRPLEPLRSLDSSGRVLYIGSFSKVLLPGLRLGFLVAPPGLRPALAKAKYLTDWHSASPAQAALAEFMDTGEYARHIRRTRREYAARRDVVRGVVERDFPELRLIGSSAGLHVSAMSSAPVRPMVLAARKAGVRIYALGDFTRPRDALEGLVFGFGAIPRERIERGLRELRAFADSDRALT
ncbi:MocR-like pyridoxine biosynthesis transcription factor PdxR [Amycolatopsis thermophila]|uniref:GntR family transcriptional regulator/MocR family aminotransferase n=1 Tax=Amycolatopsis thermophila TaxID=206084 RepID=A0ABU0EXI3_9PSEU|nr:PLP-dependent aminotransferase family protein [Amycolatopsis thermophila]MDQ0380027.1 GntR family transcriptional regulator/MocR family aminotransferase [Amycolatopsis thermophila]